MGNTEVLEATHFGSYYEYDKSDLVRMKERDSCCLKFLNEEVTKESGYLFHVSRFRKG